MRGGYQDFFSWLPEGGFLLILSVFLLLLSGWMSSVVVASRFRWLWLFALLPPTNPVAIGFLIHKRTTTAIVPLSFYMLGIVVWFSGSKMLRQLELQDLNDYKARIVESGAPIFSREYHQEAPDPDLNVWSHSFLKPLALQGQGTLNDPFPISREQSTHHKLKLPAEIWPILYENDQEERLPFPKPFKRLHQSAMAAALAEPSSNSNNIFPETLEATCGHLEKYFEEMTSDYHQLREAVHRPEDVYPHAWDEGPEMLLPHLSELNRFTKVITLKSIFHTIQGKPETSFEDAKLAFHLSQIGDSDCLISRLVQLGQLSISLDAIHAAQVYHAWTDKQWSEIQQALNHSI